MSALAPEFPLALSPLVPLRARAESLGSDDFSFLWCGQNASGCKEVSAAELHARARRCSVAALMLAGPPIALEP